MLDNLKLHTYLYVKSNSICLYHLNTCSMIYGFKGSGCGWVGIAVGSDTRGPWFESSLRQKFIYILNICLLSNVYWKDENKEKEAGNGLFLKKIDLQFTSGQRFRVTMLTSCWMLRFFCQIVHFKRWKEPKVEKCPFFVPNVSNEKRWTFFWLKLLILLLCTDSLWLMLLLLFAFYKFVVALWLLMLLLLLAFARIHCCGYCWCCYSYLP